ncbi:CLUMA_CG017596, isoform A [Clunio marinus]|uniref:CLUMA_CG017596, isoform A n=1 Tax=Clunio marinus TaxID=568069 RepID=A0A1J1J0Z5_9DIPT|nr:CLUMA_CG017596, isoform A [Clunio marinus]
MKPCGKFEYPCGDGSCIPSELVCDGKAHCFNRTDELEEVCETIQCPKYAFRCSYGPCIDRTKLCDRKKDCLDGSDELKANCKEEEENALVGCPIDKYRCFSGECIDPVKVCDGSIDCPDESDEEKSICLKAFCPKFAFRCRYGACISKDSRCDGKIDCVDGSDEDELLCGSSPQFQKIKANDTQKIPPGSCKLPSRSDIRYINEIFQEEYMAGAYVNNGEYIEIKCTPGQGMNVSEDFDYSNTCNNSEWTRKWISFPECQTICSGGDVTGITIKTICELNGKIVPCNQQHIVGTECYIECGSYYEEPKDGTHLSKKLTCLSSGSWDKLALRCEPRCGRITQFSTAYVVNGKKAQNIAEVPWTAAIYKRNILICGGSIVSERLIISAAHCFFREQPSSLSESVVLEDTALFKIAVGKYFRNISAFEDFVPQFFNVKEIISVPGYDGYMGFFSADFAIIVLDDFIVFRQHIAPICVDRDPLLQEETVVKHGLMGTVGGWGFTTAGGEPSDYLKIAKLPTVDYSKCKREAPQNFKQFVTPDKFCAGGGTDAVCQGDSGSGLTFPQTVDNEEIYYLRGIVSNARQVDGECDLNFYTMFTNVYHYMRFLNSAEKRFPST